MTNKQPKGFIFIKKGHSQNINTENENKSKKSFPFIKQANNSNNNQNSNQMKDKKTISNDLNDIFNNVPQSSSHQQNVNQDFNFANNTNQLENIFNLQADNISNNNQENKIPTLVAQKQEFNINQVYQNTTSFQQGSKANDPFNFVDDLFKKK